MKGAGKSRALIHVEDHDAPMALKVVAAMLEEYSLVKQVEIGPSVQLGKKTIRVTTTNGDNQDLALVTTLALQGLVQYTIKREGAYA